MADSADTADTAVSAAPPAGVFRLLDAADRLITSAARWALVVLMLVMTAVIFTQVVLRYGFNSSIDWADEVSRLAFVWSVFLAIPVAIRERLHIGMELLVVRLPGSWRVPLARTMNGVAVALMLLLCQQSLLLARDQWDEKMATVNASAAWFVVAVAVGAAMSVLELLRLMWTGEDANATGVVE